MRGDRRQSSMLEIEPMAIAAEKLKEKRWSLADVLALALQGRSEAELARLIGVSRQAVNLWVHGKAVPREYWSITNLCRVAGVLIENIDWLGVRRDDVKLGPPKA